MTAARRCLLAGGGHAHIEVLRRFAQRRDDHVALTVVSPEPSVCARLGHILVERGVVLHLGSGAAAVEAGTIIVTHGRRIAVDRIVWATSPAAAPWLAGSGLACDANGFVEVDDSLRSTSHPFVFAAGDCASQAGYPRPKSSAFALRQAPVLAANLRRHAHGVALRKYRPPRHALALIAIGDGRAIASRGRFVAEGDWRGDGRTAPTARSWQSTRCRSTPCRCRPTPDPDSRCASS